MTLPDYYKVLGISSGSTIDEIKRAYRKKARLYHPDINTAPDAKDMFISVTEAYEFLLSNHKKLQTDDEGYKQAMEDWRKYRQFRSRKRANTYARKSYVSFKNSNLYKTTRIFDGTAIIISIIVSIMVIVYTIYGYTYRLHHPISGLEKPSVFAFIMLLLLGTIFLVVSFIYLKAYLETLKKHKKRL